MQCCLLHLLRGVFPQQISHLFYYCCSRILLLLFSNVNKIQETRRIDILRSPEYFHCTPPPQLSNTHSTQKYKIRLIVNRNDSSNSFRKVSNRLHLQNQQRSRTTQRESLLHRTAREDEKRRTE